MSDDELRAACETADGVFRTLPPEEPLMRLCAELVRRQLASRSPEAVERLAADNERLAADNERLRELLFQYGRHDAGCSAEISRQYKCTCGWGRESAALAACRPGTTPEHDR